MHLHPLKDIIRCDSPACYFHFRAFRAIDCCGCTLSSLSGRENIHHSYITKIISLHPSTNMMENLPLHWRQSISPLKGQYRQFPSILCGALATSGTQSEGLFSVLLYLHRVCVAFSPLSFFLRMVDMLSLNSCRHPESFFSCWKPKNAWKEGWDRVASGGCRLL